MFRRKSLIHTAKNQNGVHVANDPGDRTGEPKNWPDSLCTSNRAFVFLHGYNVNPQEARGWGAEMFKRLYWAESKAQFHMVIWPGAGVAITRSLKT
ncbi:hypothetical protein M2103_000874 [Ereboglobus sp. PH5-5]|nr:hypothetical protein [Ereboglobus sp. PH5-5]